MRVTLGSLVQPKIGAKSTPVHLWAHIYARGVLKSVPTGPKGMKITFQVAPNGHKGAPNLLKWPPKALKMSPWDQQFTVFLSKLLSVKIQRGAFL